jgi:hypothetical protein
VRLAIRIASRARRTYGATHRTEPAHVRRLSVNTRGTNSSLGRQTQPFPSDYWVATWSNFLATLRVDTRTSNSNKKSWRRTRRLVSTKVRARGKFTGYREGRSVSTLTGAAGRWWCVLER